MKWGRLVHFSCLAAAVVGTGMAVSRAWQVFEPAIRWTRTEATFEGARLGYTHDGDGRLLYFVEAKVRFPVAGSEVSTVAKSGLHTHDYAEASAESRKTVNLRKSNVYFDAADPNRARFNLHYSRLYDWPMGFLIGSALGLTWFGAWFARYWAGRSTCSGCKMPLKPHFTYCPHCRTLSKPITA